MTEEEQNTEIPFTELEVALGAKENEDNQLEKLRNVLKSLENERSIERKLKL